ncbi:MAG: mannose-1-phosphate guanylyltransferase [Clostridiales bacterium]|nr:mannose-1-phosphate guanylyltransferase [Clostridiales bacterium]
MHTFSVVLAGGGGTRFWPLSRKDLPKQYLNLSGNNALINDTILRQNKLIPYEHTFIVTGKGQQKSLSEVLLKEIPKVNIFLESEGRNTAPCILYAALKVFQKYGDGVMCVFPSDNYIANEAAFQSILKDAINLAQSTNMLITIGIKPTFPSTGYGYIKYNPDNKVKVGYEVTDFIEKPVYEKACQYLSEGSYLWNSGTFVWKLSVILENFKRFLPRMYNKLDQIKECFWQKNELEVLSTVYHDLQSLSIDYGILERSGDVYVIPGDFGWNDIGSWDSLGSIFPSDKFGNMVKADHISIDSRGCIIYGNKNTIATIGLEEMIVVSVEDATLVCPKRRAQDVKQIVELLKANGRIDLL